MFFPATAALKPTPLISSRLAKPSLTPLTMLLSRARLSPCRARVWASSPSRVTTMLAPSTLAAVWLGNSQASLPLGPSTFTFRPLNSTFTLAGMVMGCFPIRDIIVLVLLGRGAAGRLPDKTEQFTAQVILASLGAAHHPLGGGN